MTSWTSKSIVAVPVLDVLFIYISFGLVHLVCRDYDNSWMCTAAQKYTFWDDIIV